MYNALRSAALAVGLVLLFAATPASATREGSFQCENVWDGPSTSNDVQACILNAERMRSQWKLFVLPFLSAVLLAILLVSFPLVFICSICCNCCGCCGANCCKPETKKSRNQARCCLWLYIVYALLWSVMVFFLIVYGTRTVTKAVPMFVDDAVSGPLSYFNQTAESVMDYTYDWSSGERREPGDFTIDFSEFSSMQEKVMEGVSAVRATVFVHFDKVSIASYVVGSLGFVMVLVILPFAMFKCCIPGFPICISFVYWIFGLAFAVLGLLLTILAYFATLTCGEVERHHGRDPGLIQWYGVPVCKEFFNFQQLNKGIMAAELQLSQGVCKAVLPFCDRGKLRGPGGVVDRADPHPGERNRLLPPGGEYPNEKALENTSHKHGNVPPASDRAGGPPHPTPVRDHSGLPGISEGPNFPDLPAVPVLNCQEGFTDASQCTTFDAMSAFVLTAEVKGSLSPCGEAGKACNLTECAARCENDQLQELAVRATSQIERVQNVTIAWSYARPLLECNFVIDKIVESLEACGDITAGTMVLGAGFFIGAIVFGLGIYIMLRGACVWGEIPMFTRDAKAS